MTCNLSCFLKNEQKILKVWPYKFFALLFHGPLEALTLIRILFPGFIYVFHFSNVILIIIVTAMLDLKEAYSIDTKSSVTTMRPDSNIQNSYC